jgi:hypothetical protein
VDLALQLLVGAAYQNRVNQLRSQGIALPSSLGHYRPLKSLD